MIDNQTSSNIVDDKGDYISRLSTSDLKWLTGSPDKIFLNESDKISYENEKLEAKRRELNSWKEQKLYDEIPDNVKTCI